MNIELENNSVPNIEKFVKDRDIKAVIFDADNTLFATQEYYDKTIISFGMGIAECLNINKPSEVIAKEIHETVFDIYTRENFRPRILQELCYDALSEYLDGNITPDILDKIDELLESFYDESPSPYESTERILKDFAKSNVNIAIHSHAQERWTGIKVALLEDLVGKDILYLATDISTSEDQESWEESFNLYGTTPSETLVVGDSLTSDILPAIEAGCRYVIWIDQYNKGLPQDINIPDDVELFKVNTLEEIITLSSK